MMLLPGGIASNDGIQRNFFFKPLTGMVELAIAEKIASPAAWPNRISGVLAAALGGIGTMSVNFDLIHDMAVGDRQFLVMMLGDTISREAVWVTQICSECSNRFDIPIQNSRLPIKPAGEGFPYASVKLEDVDEPVRFRLPTGRDQEFLQSSEGATDLRQTLAQRLIADNAFAPDTTFSHHDLNRIESAIEEVAPEVSTKAVAKCPDCQERTVFDLDPYACLRHRRIQQIFDDVDQLAAQYHWSEQEILSLPRQRRRIYLKLIDRKRGWRDSAERLERTNNLSQQ